MIQVFEISDRFDDLARVLHPIAQSLLILCFVLAIGIYALQMFENVNLEQKVLRFVISAFLIMLWPSIVITIKEFVDIFNTLLIRDVFHLNWDSSVGRWPSDQIGAMMNVGYKFWTYPIKVINLVVTLLFVAARQVVEWFFWILFFFYSVLGPFVIARGILSEDLDVFFELVKELTVLFLWQSTFVIIVGLIERVIAPNTQLFVQSEDPLGQMGKLIALAVLTVLTPALTRKFAISIGGAVIPKGLKWGGLALGLKASSMVGTRVAGAFGVSFEGLSHAAEHMWPMDKFGEFMERRKLMKETDEARAHAHEAVHEVHKFVEGEEEALSESEEPPEGGPPEVPHPPEPTHSPEPPEHEKHEEAQARVERHVTHEEVLRSEEHREKPSPPPYHPPRARVPGRKTAEEPIKEKTEEEPRAGIWAGRQRAEEEPPTKRRFRNLFESIGMLRTRSERERQRLLILAERKQILLLRGPRGSDKYNDMAQIGINHSDYASESVDTIQKYGARVRDFNARFGSLYNYRGEFTGPEKMRPKSSKDW